MVTVADATSSSRTYAGATMQERQAKRRAVLIEAALDLLAEGGIERVTVSGVSRHARLNDRYFYESFRTTDDLLMAALDAIIAASTQMIAATIDRFDGLDLTQRVSVSVAAGVEFFTGHRRNRALVLAMPATAALRARRAELIDLIATVMTIQAKELLDDKAPSETDLQLLSVTIVSGALEVLTRWLQGNLPVSREHLIEFLSAMVINSAGLPTILETNARQQIAAKRRRRK